MSTAPIRAAMMPITRRTRAYFAAMDRVNEAPVIFDPAQAGLFQLSAPPAPWIDLGWIENLERSCDTPDDLRRGGMRGTTTTQVRGPLAARVEFDFREWGKLQMALACGSEHMNVLATASHATPQPSGGTAAMAVGLLPGSTASELAIGAGVVDGFAVGDMVAVDLDYQQQTGYVGWGIAGAYVRGADDVKRDANYIRRVTFNVGRVAEKTGTSLLLGQPLVGGTPPAGASVQKVVAFVDREGGSFFQRWSALFVIEEECGGRVCFYYPQLTASTGKEEGLKRELRQTISAPLTSVVLHAAFEALAYTDENDGQDVVCYRSYFPAVAAALY